MFASNGSQGSAIRSPNAYAGPAAVALLAAVAAIATCAPERGGPGITCDEGYHVATGKRLLAAVRHQGFAFLSPSNIRRNFPWQAGGPPFHPPLGHWVIGLIHHLFDPAPDDPHVISILPGRFAAALAFGALVLVVGWWQARRCGPWTGFAASLCLALMPRVFAHAHFAALDMLSTLTFVTALLAVIQADQSPHHRRAFAVAGFLWGLAILTRLHGLLLLPPVAVWLFCRRGGFAGGPLVIWGLVALATVFAGWPWLWLSPLRHLLTFVGTATARQPLHTYYLGKTWADVQVPWHYPWVMSGVTIPTAFLVLGLFGVGLAFWQSPRRGEHALLAATAAFVLAAFSWPGAPVYDGVRLFLMVFPIWAIWTSQGLSWFCRWAFWRHFPSATRYAAAGILLANPLIPLITYAPFWLSYYNGLVGGIRGATYLGFETTYWGDSITEPLLERAARLAPGGTVALAPSLAPFQPGAITLSSPALVQQQTLLVGWDTQARSAPPGCAYAIVYRRRADFDETDPTWASREVVAENRVRGVWVARLLKLPEAVRELGAPKPFGTDASAPESGAAERTPP